MADEPVAAPETEIQDTPADAASTETPAAEQTAPSTDWEKRYNDLRPEYDRSNQLLAAARGEHGPEAQAEALSHLGVELQQDEDPEYNDEWVDPDERITALEQRLSAKEQAEKDAEFNRLEDDYIKETITDLEKEHSVKLSDKEKRIVRSDALQNRLQDDRPDLETAFADLLDINKSAHERYLESKTNTAKAPVGAAGEDKIDLSDDDARQKYMTEVFESEGGFEQDI